MPDRTASAWFRFALALAGVLLARVIQAEDEKQHPGISRPFQIEVVDDETGRGVPPGDVSARPGRRAAGPPRADLCRPGECVVDPARGWNGLAEDPRTREIAFFAPDRSGLATVPIVEDKDGAVGQRLLTSKTTGSGAGSTVERGESPLFHSNCRRCRKAAGGDRSALRIPAAGWTGTLLLSGRRSQTGLSAERQTSWPGLEKPEPSTNLVIERILEPRRWMGPAPIALFLGPWAVRHLTTRPVRASPSGFRLGPKMSPWKNWQPNSSGTRGNAGGPVRVSSPSRSRPGSGSSKDWPGSREGPASRACSSFWQPRPTRKPGKPHWPS